MDDIVGKLEQAGMIMESNRLSQRSLNAADRAIILEARISAARTGWGEGMIESVIEEGRAKIRARLRHETA